MTDSTGVEVVAWLVLPPFWTLQLAQKCQFPVLGESTIAETFELTQRQGLCEFRKRQTDRTHRPLVNSDFLCIVPEPVRAEYITLLRESKKVGLTKLQTIGCQIGKTITELNKRNDSVVPDSLDYWAELASLADNQGLLASKLSEIVSTLLKDGQSGKAIRWLEAAEKLVSWTDESVKASYEACCNLMSLVRSEYPHE